MNKACSKNKELTGTEMVRDAVSNSAYASRGVSGSTQAETCLFLALARLARLRGRSSWGR